MTEEVEIEEVELPFTMLYDARVVRPGECVRLRPIETMDFSGFQDPALARDIHRGLARALGETKVRIKKITLRGDFARLHSWRYLFRI